LGAEVTAIELDRGLAADLRRWPEAESGQLAVIEKDVLKVDLESSLGPGPLMVCGNLPYNISTPLLFWYTRQAKTAPVGVFMLQKEVAERLCAAPGGRDYGRLTVAVSLWHEVRLVFEVPSAAFSPRPKVKSAVVCLTPVPDGPTISREALGRLTMAAFHARRKTIFNNLSAVYGRLPASEALEKLGLAAEVRAETLPPQTLAALAALLEKSDPGAASGGDEIAGFNLTGGQTTD
jgi:16S rRNA (adenine1518-N6/adenine1519-N6)-dimethyltransferase